MGGVVRKWLQRLQKCIAACICSVRVSGRVALRGICGRLRVDDVHVVSGTQGKRRPFASKKASRPRSKNTDPIGGVVLLGSDNIAH
jgi:hypothetical protein